MNSASVPVEISALHRQAAAFVADLIVCRSQIQFYPDSHPAVAGALNKAIVRLQPLISGGRPLSFGITRQGLIFQEATLDPNNAKFREYASLLSSLGIIAISFTESVQPEDILRFNRVINRPRNEVWESGGIMHAFEINLVRSIHVQAIDLSVFTLSRQIGSARTGKPVDVWEDFAKKLLQGCFSSAPEITQELLSASPETLAGKLVDMLNGIPDDARQITLKALADFYVGQSIDVEPDKIRHESLDELTAFISGLEPKIRCDFIINICNSPHATTDFNELLLHKLPEDGLQEVARAVALNGAHISDMLLNLLKRLASHSEIAPDMDTALSGSDVGSKVGTLLRETDLEQYIPQNYLQTLTSILATDKLPDVETGILHKLQATLETDRLENKITDIINVVVSVIPDAGQSEGIRCNLLGQMEFYLKKQDFTSLAKVCRILSNGSDNGSETVFNQDFVNQILDAASIAGRDRYHEIRELIDTVKGPFIEPLIEKLIIEENRSLRRFWFDCLDGQGNLARQAALARLNTGQWYVIRNMLVILRNFSDQEVVNEVRRFTEHKHPKVRSEALRNLLHYRDPAADKTILADLRDSDPVRKLAAVQIAEMSRNTDVMQELLEILERTGITDFQLELKTAVVQTLASIGNPASLPVLLNIISSNPLLHRSKHAQLKIEVIRALPRFHADYVRPILERISVIAEDKLAAHALEALKYADGTKS